ncbi:MAG: hypothetical protein QM736_04150 [Vicinamibacterales bacterium]
MRVLLYVAVLVVAGASLHAQVNGVMLPVPPLPTIGLPLAHIGLPPADEPSSAPPSASTSQDTRSEHRRARSLRTPTLLVVPTIVIANAPAPAPSHASRRNRTVDAPRPEPGVLELAITADEPYQIVVDDHFVGSSETVGRWLSLEPGSHAIELRADGASLRTFKVAIEAGQTLTYKDQIRTSPPSTNDRRASSASPAPAKGPIYIIAGCYAGNVAPERVTLPAGCDRSRVTVIEP